MMVARKARLNMGCCGSVMHDGGIARGGWPIVWHDSCYLLYRAVNKSFRMLPDAW